MKLIDTILSLDSELSSSSATDNKVISISGKSILTGRITELLRLEGNEEEWDSFINRLRKKIER